MTALKKEQLQLFRLHNPNYNDTFIKMELMTDLTPSAEIHVDLTKVEPGSAKAAKPSQQPAEAEELTRDVAEIDIPNTAARDYFPNRLATEQHQDQSPYQQQEQNSVTMPAIPQEQQLEQQVADVSCMPTNTVATIGFRSLPEPQYSEMTPHQEYVQRISLHPENCVQHHNSSNNGVQPLNLNLMDQWTRQRRVKYASPQAPLETPPQQQQPIMWQWQVHNDTSYSESGQEELQQLNAQYQRLKYQEDEQLKIINKSLKDVCVNRLISERQHAQHHRMFMHNMIEFKKQEEHLQMQREHLKRQFGDELAHLLQRITEKHRQLQQQTRTWQWQQQQQQQQYLQLAQYQRQQHFLNQLQPPSNRLPRLQCFQDAFSTHFSEILYTAEEAHQRITTSHQPPAPPQPATTPAPPSPSVYTLPSIAHTSELSGRNGRITRRRHTIDQRQNHIHPYVQAVNPFQPYQSTSPNYVHCPATMGSSNTAPAVHNFAIPETAAPHNRTQVNQGMEETAITSIIRKQLRK